MLQGVFGYAGGTTIRDVTVEGTLTVEQTFIFGWFGTIAAYAENAKITNCTAKLSFDNHDFFLNGYAIGGIAANAYETTKVQNCYSTTAITVLRPATYGAHRFGGIVGSFAGGKEGCAVEHCYFAGTINTDGDGAAALQYVGGIIGRINAANVALKNNYSSIQETSKGDLPVYGDKDGGSLKTIEYMSTEAFVAEINNGGGNYIFSDGETPVIPPATYSVTVNSSEGGSASAADDLMAASPGDEVTLTATPEQDYHFKEWSVEGGNITIKDNKFIMPYGEVSITAVFEKHYGGEATCTDKAVCEVCGSQYGEAAGHKVERIPAKEATATEAGNIEYWYCSVCGKYFKDEALTAEITKADTALPATGESFATGDNSDITLWLALAGAALCGLLGTAIYGRKRRSAK